MDKAATGFSFRPRPEAIPVLRVTEQRKIEAAVQRLESEEVNSALLTLKPRRELQSSEAAQENPDDVQEGMHPIVAAVRAYKNGSSTLAATSSVLECYTKALNEMANRDASENTGSDLSFSIAMSVSGFIIAAQKLEQLQNVNALPVFVPSIMEEKKSPGGIIIS